MLFTINIFDINCRIPNDDNVLKSVGRHCLSLSVPHNFKTVNSAWKSYQPNTNPFKYFGAQALTAY